MKVTETWNDGRASVSYFQGGKLVLNETSGGGSASRTDYVYDAAGQEVESFRQVDTNGDGVFDSSTRTLKAWDSGRVVSETQLSPDFDGDGLEGDYSSVTNYAYDAAGRLTWKGTVNYTYGSTTGSDYRNEAWAYNADGTLASYAIDDPIMFDCVITRTNQYKYGNLMTIKEQNEIRYAHTADPIKFYTDESFTYNKDGTLKTKTDWADRSEYGWFQRVDTSFTWGSGYDSQRITYDLEGDWKAERVKLVENWYNSAGQQTHVLTSHDVDGNGTWDSRDLIVRTFNEYGLASETVDYGADGTIEASYTKVVEPDFVLA